MQSPKHKHLAKKGKAHSVIRYYKSLPTSASGCGWGGVTDATGCLAWGCMDGFDSTFSGASSCMGDCDCCGDGGSAPVEGICGTWQKMKIVRLGMFLYIYICLYILSFRLVHTYILQLPSFDNPFSLHTIFFSFTLYWLR